MSPVAIPRLHKAALVLLLAFAGRGNAQPLPAATVEASGDAVVFDGQINLQSAASFFRLLQDPKITRLVITSRGGMVSAALDMANAIHERQLDVEVPTACHSSCANYIFPAARRKTLGRADAVAWHGNMTHVLYLQQTGQASWSDDLMEGARQLARREREFFRRIGVDGFVCWFGKVAPYNVDDFYWLSAGDMQGFGIGQVTVREPAVPATDGGEVRHVSVDWDGLPAIRPAVQFDP
jgi:hypothetical protein